MENAPRPDDTQSEDERCSGCGHADQHYTACPVEGESWICERAGCACAGFEA
jgi:hypothetical protein